MEEKETDEESDFIGFSPIKDKISTESDIVQANSLAKQLHVYKPGIDFVPGARLEVLDARDNKWYLCKVVEVDWGELDILVHYERWSIRFDEWLKMDSTRIRPALHKRESKKAFKVGEKVLAFWAPDGRMYSAQILGHLSDDYWNVLFFDGFTKTLRTSQIKKIFRKPSTEILSKSIASSSAQPTEEVKDNHPTHSTSSQDSSLSNNPSEILEAISGDSKRNIFNVEILKEKRKTTRKPNVEELFQSLKKKRKIDNSSDDDDSWNIKDKMPKKKVAKLQLDKDVFVPKTEKEDTSEPPKLEDAKKLTYFEIDVGEGWRKVCSKRVKDLRWDVYYVSPGQKKMRSRQEIMKQLIENPNCKLNPILMDFSVKTALLEYERQQKESPTTIKIEPENEASEDSAVEGFSQYDTTSINIEPSLLEECIKRETIDNSKSDEEGKTIIDTKKVSFQKKNSEEETKLSSTDNISKEDIPLLQRSMVKSFKHQPISEPGSQGTGNTSSPTVVRRSSVGGLIATPKTRSKGPVRKDPSLIIDSPVYSNMESSHHCPKKGCEKSFRKESLLQMHMKHYHPDLLKRSSVQAPNVADLAYRRTIGDHLGGDGTSSGISASPTTPSPEKVSKVFDKKSPKSFLGFEQKKSAGNKDFLKKDLEVISSTLSSSETDESDSDEDYKIEDDEDSKDKIIMKTDPDYTPVSDPNVRRSNRNVDKSKLRSKKTSHLHLSVKEEKDEESDTEPTKEDCAIIHCSCGSNEEDGLMLQCDICLCWQHGTCLNIDNESQVPDKYICSLCENPKGLRSSLRFRHHQDWLKEGKLPRFSFSGPEVDTRLECSIRKGHDLMANVLQLSQVLYSLRLKLSIAKNDDHPKFVMWYKKWLDSKDEFDKDEEVEDLRPENVADILHQLSQHSLLTMPPTDPQSSIVDHHLALPEPPMPQNSEGEPILGPILQQDLSIAQAPFQQISNTEFAHSQHINVEPSNLPDLNTQPICSQSIGAEQLVSSQSMGVVQSLCSQATGNVQLSPSHPIDTVQSVSSQSVDIVPSPNHFVATSVLDPSTSEQVNVQSTNQEVFQLQPVCSESSFANSTTSTYSADTQTTNVDVNSTGSDTMNIETISAQATDKPVNSESLDKRSDSLQELGIDSPAMDIDPISSQVMNRDPTSSQGLDTNSVSFQTLDKDSASSKVKDVDSSSFQDMDAHPVSSHIMGTDPVISKVTDPSSVKCLSVDIDSVNDQVMESVSLPVSGDSFEIGSERLVSAKVSSVLENSSKNEGVSNLEISSSHESHTKMCSVTGSYLKETVDEKNSIQTQEVQPISIPSEASVVKRELPFEENIMDKKCLPEHGENKQCSIIKKDITQTFKEIELEPIKEELTEANKTIEANDEFGSGKPDLSGVESKHSFPDEFGEALSDKENPHDPAHDLTSLEDLFTQNLEQLVLNNPLEVPVNIPPAPIIPETERIEPVKCRINLLQHIDRFQTKISNRYDHIEDQIRALENEMGLTSDFTKEEEEMLSSEADDARYSVTLQGRSLVQFILKDLDAVKNMLEYNAV